MWTMLRRGPLRPLLVARLLWLVVLRFVAAEGSSCIDYISGYSVISYYDIRLHGPSCITRIASN
jgi:hypothetical protein